MIIKGKMFLEQGKLISSHVALFKPLSITLT